MISELSKLTVGASLANSLRRSSSKSDKRFSDLEPVAPASAIFSDRIPKSESEATMQEKSIDSLFKYCKTSQLMGALVTKI